MAMIDNLRLPGASGDLQPLGTNDLRADLLSGHAWKGLVERESNSMDGDVPFPLWALQERTLGHTAQDPRRTHVWGSLNAP